MIESHYINTETIQKINNRLNKKDANMILVDNDTLYHSKRYGDISQLIENTVLEDLYYDERKNTSSNKGNLLKSIEDSESIIVLSHFKGHSLLGFSGAIKNASTGLVKRDEQIKLHRLVQPFISKISCLACNECVKACPEEAITLNSIAQIDKQICTGCNICISSCPNSAIKLNKIYSEFYMKGLCESLSDTLKNTKGNKILFINTLISIKPYYDNNIINNEVLVDDIGILASYDPVAIDKASYDLVNHNGIVTDNINDLSIDKFKQIWRNINSSSIFEYAEEFNLGTKKYELIEL